MDKRIVVASLASAIVGGLVGGAVTYLTVKKTFAERAQRDIDDVKKEYHDRFDGKRVVNVYGDVVDPKLLRSLRVTSLPRIFGLLENSSRI